MKAYFLIKGNLTERFGCLGPFSDFDEAAEADDDGTGWVMEGEASAQFEELLNAAKDCVHGCDDCQLSKEQRYLYEELENWKP